MIRMTEVEWFSKKSIFFSDFDPYDSYETAPFKKKCFKKSIFAAASSPHVKT